MSAVQVDLTSGLRAELAEPDEDYPAECEGCPSLKESYNEIDVHLLPEFRGYYCSLKTGERCEREVR